jgi:hypothetical protein
MKAILKMNPRKEHTAKYQIQNKKNAAVKIFYKPHARRRIAEPAAHTGLTLVTSQNYIEHIEACLCALEKMHEASEAINLALAYCKQQQKNPAEKQLEQAKKCIAGIDRNILNIRERAQYAALLQRIIHVDASLALAIYGVF